MEVSYGAYQEWRKQNNVFEDIAVVSSVNLDMPLTGGAEPQQVESTIVSHPFFPTLGVKARLGRIFAAGDDRPGASNVVISSRVVALQIRGILRSSARRCGRIPNRRRSSG